MSSSQRCLKFVQSVFESFQANSGLEPRLLNGLRVTAARPGVVNFELPIEKHHTNRLNILHGGTIASMVDLGGSLAVASRGLFATGVSTDLNVTYLNSGGKIGDLIRAEVTCDKYMGVLTIMNTVGKTLAYTSILFHNEKQQLVARGSHTKYVTLAWKDPNNIVEEMSPEPEK
ncbi:DEAD-domain-containing protein [Aureobasidium sp. EXF-8845]|nr:DEAD-domain-containing protein [Aureobasidium sp. EXF-8845]